MTEKEEKQKLAKSKIIELHKQYSRDELSNSFDNLGNPKFQHCTESEVDTLLADRDAIYQVVSVKSLSYYGPIIEDTEEKNPPNGFKELKCINNFGDSQYKVGNIIPDYFKTDLLVIPKEVINPEVFVKLFYIVRDSC